MRYFPLTLRCFCFAGFATFTTVLGAQVNSNTASVTLNAILPESLTVSASPSSVNFTLVPGSVALGSSPVVITTNWTLGANRSSVSLFAWFSNPAAALSDGASPANTIGSGAVFGQVTSGAPTTFTAFQSNGALGTSGGTLQLFTQSIGAATRSANRSDNLSLKIDLSGLPQLPAGTYTGVLMIQAQSL